MAAHRIKPGTPKLPGSGRKKGTPNKKTLMFKETLAELGFDPAKAMVYCYNENIELYKTRRKHRNFSAAIDALNGAAKIADNLAQFAYPKHKAVELTGEVGVRTFADFMSAGGEDPSGTEEKDGEGNAS